MVSSRENIEEVTGIGFDGNILCSYVKFIIIIKRSKSSSDVSVVKNACSDRTP